MAVLETKVTTSRPTNNLILCGCFLYPSEFERLNLDFKFITLIEKSIGHL
jgi:hypothetical protein